MYVEASNLKTQENLDTIANWTTQNVMKLNEEKCKYMLFSRSETEVATRLTLNNNTLERIEETKLVGVWITTWLDWEKNTREICKKAYARMTMLTKLKNAGVPAQDLITVYILFIRSLLEYCSVAWHSTLTGEQNQKLERVQKLCLKVILGEHYKDCCSALDTCGLDWYQREIQDPWARLLGPHSDVTTAASLACEPAPSSKTTVLYCRGSKEAGCFVDIFNMSNP